MSLWLIAAFAVALAVNAQLGPKFHGLRKLHVGAGYCWPTPPSFGNSVPIDIIQFGVADPYPSDIVISCLDPARKIVHIEVGINGLSHRFPDDIDMLLVAPNGESVVLMSDCGGDTDMTSVYLKFTDTAVAFLPNTTAITSGTYLPTNYGAGDPFTPPAPVGAPTYTDFNNSAFLGGSPNGTWSLYIMDDQGGDGGSITSWYVLFQLNP